MKKNNSKKTYQLVKDLTSTKQGRTTTMHDKDGKCLTEEQDILKRWSEYCSELYNYSDTGYLDIPNVPPATNNDNYPILREEVKAAVTSLKQGKSAGADNGAGAGRGRSHDKRPTDYLQQDLADRGVAHTVDPISHHHPPQQRQPTAMPELSYYQPHQPPEQRYAENLAEPTEAASGKDHIAEEQAGFRPGRSTTEQTFNLRILCEKYLQHQQDLYHFIMDFKKAFNRVWHAALWSIIRQSNILFPIVCNSYLISCS